MDRELRVVEVGCRVDIPCIYYDCLGTSAAHVGCFGKLYLASAYVHTHTQTHINVRFYIFSPVNYLGNISLVSKDENSFSSLSLCARAYFDGLLFSNLCINLFFL